VGPHRDAPPGLADHASQGRDLTAVALFPHTLVPVALQAGLGQLSFETGELSASARQLGQAGLDMMLLPEFRGRGLGPKVARTLVEHLCSARGWTDITVDPAQDNARAIRAWQKAGFTIEREWPDHPDGPALLMRLTPPASAP
jgi:GNAT superfamily N-acetyltransferase